MVYSGDPLRDLGLTAFLDKFVNKKPKVRRGCGASEMWVCLRYHNFPCSSCEAQTGGGVDCQQGAKAEGGEIT